MIVALSRSETSTLLPLAFESDNVSPVSVPRTLPSAPLSTICSASIVLNDVCGAVGATGATVAPPHDSTMTNAVHGATSLHEIERMCMAATLPHPHLHHAD